MSIEFARDRRLLQKREPGKFPNFLIKRIRRRRTVVLRYDAKQMVRELTGMPRLKFQSLFGQRSFLDIECSVVKQALKCKANLWLFKSENGL